MLYDAIAVLTGPDGGAVLADEPAARDFLSDAFNHYKVIGLGGATDALVEAAGLTDKLDTACVGLDTAKDSTTFVSRIAGPREWDRNLDA